MSDILNHPTIKLCMNLVKEQSITPDDANCQKIITDRIEKLGFQSTTLTYDDVTNLWSTRFGSKSDTPLLVFAGHTDVVPTGDINSWHTDPFSPEIIEGKLFGRGVADMKGSLAAMVVAAERFIENHPEHQGRIGFLLTSDEEGPAINGTVKVMEYLEKTNEKIDYCIVGEPSSTSKVGDTIKVGRRGSLNAVLKVKGIQGHVAYPHLARNPIHQVSPALTALSTKTWDEGNSEFPATSFQISNIQAGTGATNVIPGQATVTFNFRFSTENSSENLQAETIKILNEHELEYDITWRLSGHPFLTKQGQFIDKVRESIFEVTGYEAQTSTSGGTSDGRFIAPYGVEVIELGPTNATIHQTNEHLAADELIVLTDIYYKILESLLL